jgi:hypothetical protein
VTELRLLACARLGQLAILALAGRSVTAPQDHGGVGLLELLGPARLAQWRFTWRRMRRRCA